MGKVKIFETSNGDVYAFPEDQELARVKAFLHQADDARPVDVRSRIDTHGAVTHWREDDPARWCRSYPCDHPSIPAPKDFDQRRKVLPRKPEPRESKIFQGSDGSVRRIDARRELDVVVAFLWARLSPRYSRADLLRIDNDGNGLTVYTLHGTAALWCKVFAAGRPDAPAVTECNNLSETGVLNG